MNEKEQIEVWCRFYNKNIHSWNGCWTSEETTKETQWSTISAWKNEDKNFFEKLVSNLHDKENYVVHIKQILNHGLVLKKVYRLIKKQDWNHKGYLCYRAIFGHNVATDLQLMIFFLFEEKNSVVTKIFRFLCFCIICKFQNIWCHQRHGS